MSVFILDKQVPVADLYQAMTDRIEKVYAMISLALDEQLFDRCQTSHQNYLWVIVDMLAEIKELSMAVMEATSALDS